MLARVIKSLTDKGPTNRTALATAAGVSYDRLLLYLNWMTEKGLVAIREDGSVVLTPQGAQAYNELVKWIIDHVGAIGLSHTRFSFGKSSD